jgi:hypothetical protein
MCPELLKGNTLCLESSVICRWLFVWDGDLGLLIARGPGFAIVVVVSRGDGRRYLSSWSAEASSY